MNVGLIWRGTRTQTWEPHVIIENVPRTINLDTYDFDGCAIPEIAMGHNFETDPARSVGNVLILKAGTDPRNPWMSRENDRVPTVHRLRWIDLNDNGKKVLLVAPMIGLKARPAAYGDAVPVGTRERWAGAEACSHWSGRGEGE